jgi:hypothetical protein
LLNVVERFFQDLTTDRIRSDSFTSVPDLIAAIHDYIDRHNEDPRPFILTAEADKILEKVGRARTALLSQHSVRHYTRWREKREPVCHNLTISET